MNGETASLVDLHKALRLAADEYTSFRNQMLRCAQLTVEQVDGAIKRADKVVALLRIIRGREAILAAQPSPAPEAYYCPRCGAGIGDKKLFVCCPACGLKLEQG